MNCEIWVTLKRIKLAGIMEETLISEIRNFTATGYQSEIFKEFVKSTPLTLDMARNEIDDWEWVHPKDFENFG